MSFIAGMVSSLKANKRNRISTFEKLENYKNGNYSELHFDKKSTPSQLKRIKEKLQKENKKKLIRKVLVISTFLIVLIYFVGFYKF